MAFGKTYHLKKAEADIASIDEIETQLCWRRKRHAKQKFINKEPFIEVRRLQYFYYKRYFKHLFVSYVDIVRFFDF